MLDTLLRLFGALLAFLAGRRAGAAAVQARETAQEEKVEDAIHHADEAVPVGRPAVEQRLRDGRF